MKKNLTKFTKIKLIFVNLTMLSRVFFTLIIAILLAIFAKKANFNYFYAAFAIFVFASLTDWLDGFLARKWKVVSDFGRVFDPIADKILTTTIFALFAFLQLIPWFLMLIFILRDIVIDGIRIFLAQKKVVVAANFWGKCKTVAQILAICLIFLAYSISPKIYENNFYFFNISVIFAAILSLISGFFYFLEFIKLLKIK